MIRKLSLKPSQFAWAMQGGFKNIQRALGEKIAVFNVVLKSLTISGTQLQHETALDMLDDKRDVEVDSSPDKAYIPEGDCPICFCEAEKPLQFSCRHIYYHEFYQEYHKLAAPTSKDRFQVKFQGDGGNCSTIFTRYELEDHPSTSAFEDILKSSFAEYIQRHLEDIHYCPSPGCCYFFPYTIVLGSKPPAYTCPDCFEPICTSCHSRHVGYICAEYKDITSVGYAAVEKQKKGLNIENCPKFTAPREKTEGCNRMTCGGF